MPLPTGAGDAPKLRDTPRQPATATKAVSLTTLTAMVVGTMVGAGVFSLPSNFAEHAGLVGSAIAWLIAGVGMLMVTIVFQWLAKRRPDLDAGMYSYAKAGFGNYPGFMAAFGYWASSVIGNVTYWVLIMSTLSIAFPELGAGDTTLAAACSIVGVWLFHALIARGVREAAILNRIVTIAKVLPIILFIVVGLVVADLDMFKMNLWGSPDASLFTQVRGTMMITLFVLLGVEGATIFSRFARKRSDVGKATIGGFLGVLAMFALVSLVGFGSFSQNDIAHINQPSIAGVFAEIVGPWGSYFMSAALILAVLGAYLSWTLMAAEVLYAAAANNDMPRYMRKVNKHGTPINALLTSSITASMFVLVARFSEDAFNFSLVMTGTMALVPYLFATWYGLRLAIADRNGTSVKKGLSPYPASHAEWFAPQHLEVTETLGPFKGSEASGAAQPDTTAHSNTERAGEAACDPQESYEACTNESDAHVVEAGGSTNNARTSDRGVRNIVISAMAMVFSIALIVAAGYEAVLFAAILYVPGTILFVMTRKERGESVFTKREIAIFSCIAACALVAVVLLVTGNMSV